MRFIFAFILLLITSLAHADERFITLASTTSTQNSGLYDYLLPIFTAETDIKVRVVAVGTGQAIKIAKNGDADVLLVHHRASEDIFVADGYGIERRDVMYNDFVLIGPKSERISEDGFHSLSNIFNTFKDTGAYKFISRGDESGTHKKEKELWENYTGDIPNGNWYREIGAGMGAALNMASSIDAYTLSDRGTWLSFGNKGDLEIVWQGDKKLFNPYGMILVNPAKHPHVKVDLARTFFDWMISNEGQAAIGAFTVNNMQLFCPNADAEKAKDAICPTSIPVGR